MSDQWFQNWSSCSSWKPDYQQGEDIFKNKSPVSFVNYNQACFLGHKQLMRALGGHGGNSDYDLLDAKQQKFYLSHKILLDVQNSATD